MQLCSQEWLTALERHAGVSFTKLLREGRHVASSTDEVSVTKHSGFISLHVNSACESGLLILL